MSSSVPAAVNNLMNTVLPNALPAQMNGAPVQIAFGELPEYVQPVTVTVLEVIGDQDPGEMGRNYRREETYSIVCEIVTWAGDQDYLQRFTDAMTCFNAISKGVGNNPWLSATGLHDSTAAVRYAEVGNFSIVPHPDTQGQSRCDLQFHVRCSQRIDSLE